MRMEVKAFKIDFITSSMIRFNFIGWEIAGDTMNQKEKTNLFRNKYTP